MLVYLHLANKLTQAQFMVSGTVFDSSKINYVPNVTVMNTSGKFVFTDSLGFYTILVSQNDSLTFTFRNKSTQKFAVHSVLDPTHFDIWLRVAYKSKYNTLKEVFVKSKSYKEDSIANRQDYANVFNFQKPGLETSISPTGGVGLDANEIINIFRFKRNKRLKAFQLKLEADEQEKYVNYRFNKNLIKRITQLDGEMLTLFMNKYRPTFQFVSLANEVSFNQYIINCFYKFKLQLLQN